jgi:hypothetical protein
MAETSSRPVGKLLGGLAVMLLAAGLIAVGQRGSYP